MKFYNKHTVWLQKLHIVNSQYILYSLPLIESTDMIENNTDVRAYILQN